MSDVLALATPVVELAGELPARWLAQRMLFKDIAGLQKAVPAPWLVSDHPRRSERQVRDYIMRWVARPVSGSCFAVRTRWLRWLPSRLLVRLLANRGYDGLLYALPDRIIGHVFFQRHGDAIHIFSAAVDEEFEGRGYSGVMLLDCLTHASGLKGVTLARMGTGANVFTQRFLQRLRRHEAALGWQVGEDGWVEFNPGLMNAEQAITRRAA
jgi:hypothetical protein